MLVIKKELNTYDFEREFEDIMKDFDGEAIQIIFDSLCDVLYDGADEMQVRDYIRFQLEIQTLDEVVKNYDIVSSEDVEALTDDEIFEMVENYLMDNTYYLGHYEDNDGEIILLFDEF